MLNLNFNLSTSEERQKFIEQYMEGQHFTQKELETIANYLLYGKDADGLNSVDKKEIQIDTRYDSYKKKRPESLESLLESPGFNENRLSQTNIHYKSEKPTIDREKDSKILGMAELWENIDRLQRTIDLAEGKIEPDPNEKVPTLTKYQLYKLKHHLISLRKEQYYLKDSNKIQTLIEYIAPTDPSILWDFNENYSIAPLGLYSSNPLRFTNPRALKEYDYSYNSKAKYVLDFRNPEHIYYLIEYYEDFLITASTDPESTLGSIIETLNFYINLANLDDIKLEILKMKQLKFSNLAIQNVLKEKYNCGHSTNYISTIYKQKICGEIAEAARYHYDMYMARDDMSKWKRCNQCGEVKFLDTHNFMRKTKSSDGYNSKCKKCCKENRKKK